MEGWRSFLTLSKNSYFETTYYDRETGQDEPLIINGYNHWGESGKHESATCGLRPSLNSTGIHEGEGFYHAFTDAFKAMIIPVNIPNRHWETGKGYTTVDRVFIPSTTELGDKVHRTTYKIGNVFPYFSGAGDDMRKAYNNCNLHGRYSYHYWTRSPDSLHFHGMGYLAPGGREVKRVNSSGSVLLSSRAAGRISIRPAINLEQEAEVSLYPNSEGVYIIGSDVEYLLLEGKISSGMNLFEYSPSDVPMPYMQVELVSKDEDDSQVLIEVDTVTDREGKYQIFVKEAELETLIDENEGETFEDLFPLETELSLIYNYHRDELDYFTMRLDGQADLIPTLTVSVNIEYLGMEFDSRE